MYQRKNMLYGLTDDDAIHLNQLVKASDRLLLPKCSKKKRCRKPTTWSTVVNFDNNSTPVDLLGGGEHFAECPPRCLDEIATNHTMDKLMKIIESNKLTRPIVS